MNNEVPVIKIKQLSDLKWQHLSLLSRLEEPQKYINAGENVNTVIKTLHDQILINLCYADVPMLEMFKIKRTLKRAEKIIKKGSDNN